MLIIDELLQLIPEDADFEPCVFKLSSGDTLATFAVNANDKYYVLLKPTRFVSHMDEEGYMTTSLVRYLYGTDDTLIELKKDHIVSSAFMSEDLFETYDKLQSTLWSEEQEDIDTKQEGNVIKFPPSPTKH